MNIQVAFTQIHWLSVIVASLSAFAVGSLWYSLLFGKIWQKEIGLTDEDIKHANMPLIFGLSFILEFIAALSLEMFIGPDSNLKAGAFTGALVSIAWIATAIGTNYLYGRKSLRLYLIDAGYFVAFFTIMGGILGAW